MERRLRKTNLPKKNKAAANALISLLTRLDADGEERLSGYDRERVCVPQVCDCRRSTCRYLAFLSECEVKRYPFQICNHNLLLADAIHRSTGRRSLLPAGGAVVIDEAHKLPEAARQMFGVTLGAEDIRSLIVDLESERLKTAASSLQRASEPLVARLERPCDNRKFSAYARQLVPVSRMLPALKKATANQATPQTRRKLMDLSSTIEYLTDKSEHMSRKSRKAKRSSAERWRI